MPEPVRNTKLDEQHLAALGGDLGRALQQSGQQASGFLEKIQVYRDLYAGELPEKPERWMANIHEPIMEGWIKTAAKKIAAQAIGPEPMFVAEADDPQSDEWVQGVEQFMQVNVEAMRLKTTVSMGIHESLLVGQAWLKDGIKLTGKQLPDAMAQPTTMLRDLPFKPVGELVTTEDMKLVPFTAPSFDRARGAFAKTTLTWNEIANNKSFYKSSVDTLKVRWGQSVGLTPSQQQQDIGAWTPTGIWDAEFTCYEGYFSWVTPGDKAESKWYILAYYPEDVAEAVILRCVDYSTVYGDECMFSLLVHDPQPNSMWGRPLAASLSHIQKHTNVTFSQGTDAVTVNILPTMIAPAGSDFVRKNLRFSPLGIISGTPGEIQPVPMPSNSLAAVAATFQQMEYGRNLGERLAYVTDVTSGKVSEQNRTKFEIGLVAQNGDEMAEFQVSIFEIGTSDGDGLAGFARKVWADLARWMPKDRPVSYKVKKGGTNTWPAATPEWFEGSYTFSLHGANRQGSQEARIAKAQATLEKILTSPFCAYSIADTVDGVIAKTQRLWRAFRDFASGVGHKDPEEWIGNEPQSLEDCLPVVSIMAPQVALQITQQALAESGQPMPMAGVPTGPSPIEGAGPASGAGGDAGQGGIPGQPFTGSGMAAPMQ